MNHIILGDLHAGGGTNLDIFHAQSPPSDFLKSLGDEPRTVIVSGDFIDFIAVKPYAVFNRQAVRQKIERIHSAGGNRVRRAGRRSVRGDSINSRPPAKGVGV